MPTLNHAAYAADGASNVVPGEELPPSFHGHHLDDLRELKNVFADQRRRLARRASGSVACKCRIGDYTVSLNIEDKRGQCVRRKIGERIETKLRIAILPALDVLEGVFDRLLVFPITGR